MQQSSTTGRVAEVYGLYDGDGQLLYVGVTSTSAKERLRGHRYAASKGSEYPLYRWMRENGDPEVRILQSEVPVERMFDIEAEWISALKPPFNQIIKWDWTEDQIRRRVEAQRTSRPQGWFSDAAREKARIANTGRPGFWLGKRMAEAHVSGFSGEKNGHAVLTNAQVIRARQRWRAGESVSSIAADLGFRYQTIFRAVKGKTYTRVPGGPKGPPLPPTE